MTAFAVVVGIALRLIWPSDMEYKHDEAYVYAHSITGGLPSVGEAASVGIPNPGLGQWVYWLVAHVIRGIAGTVSPVGLVRALMLVNCLALVALLAFSLTSVPERQRRPWLWATMLLALNPVAILLSRKLWLQCMIAPFTLAAIWGWRYRDTRKGAFAWGVLGACLGQVHMAGFFLALGFATWTLLRDRSSTRWRWWLLGSALGAVPLIPWVVYLLGAHSSSTYNLSNLVKLRFWLYWLLTPLGLPLYETFQADKAQLMAWPSIGGIPLHLMQIATGIAVLGGLGVYVLAARAAIRARRAGTSALGLLAGTDTARLLGIGTIAFGIFLTANGEPIYRHYITAAFVLPFVTLAVFALRIGRMGRWLLTAIVISQAMLSIGYLTYVHSQGGSPASDYGYTYARQIKGQAAHSPLSATPDR